MVPNLSFGGVQSPAFGLVLHALQKSSDVNVLSTPHILTTDNEEAEITVGQNVPFQWRLLGGGLGGLSGLASAAGRRAALLGGLGGLGGWGALGALVRRRLDSAPERRPEALGEAADQRERLRAPGDQRADRRDRLDNASPAGPATSKRSAKTTVVAKDQETVVIGGIMQDRIVESVSKVPILGDIPLLGNLFRSRRARR